MSEVKMTACDHCGKRVDNPYAERGWIRLEGGTAIISVSRSTGVYAKGSYQSDYLQRVRDFCSAACLVAALDQKARERADQEAKEEKKQARS